MAAPRQLVGHVLDSRPSGAYTHLTIAAPGVASAGVAGTASPGQFVAVAVGGPTSATLLRRCFSLYAVRPGEGDRPDTLEIVVAAKGPGTVWLTQRRVGDLVDVVAPLGRPFPLPQRPTGCVLVGGGYGAAPLFWLAEQLRARGCTAHVVLGAARADRLFGVEHADRVDGLHVTTDDGSAGTRGWVSTVLPDVLAQTQADTVYACGPMGMLRSVTEIAAGVGARAFVAVEEAMACGVGVCMTCVLPIVGGDGQTRMTRSCVDGPVFDGAQVRWDAYADGICRVPPDAVGAPQAGAH